MATRRTDPKCSPKQALTELPGVEGNTAKDIAPKPPDRQARSNNEPARAGLSTTPNANHCNNACAKAGAEPQPTHYALDPDRQLTRAGMAIERQRDINMQGTPY